MVFTLPIWPTHTLPITHLQSSTFSIQNIGICNNFISNLLLLLLMQFQQHKYNQINIVLRYQQIFRQHSPLFKYSCFFMVLNLFSIEISFVFLLLFLFLSNFIKQILYKTQLNTFKISNRNNLCLICKYNGIYINILYIYIFIRINTKLSQKEKGIYFQFNINNICAMFLLALYSCPDNGIELSKENCQLYYIETPWLTKRIIIKQCIYVCV